MCPFLDLFNHRTDVQVGGLLGGPMNWTKLGRVLTSTTYGLGVLGLVYFGRYLLYLVYFSIYLLYLVHFSVFNAQPSVYLVYSLGTMLCTVIHMDQPGKGDQQRHPAVWSAS
jgi:hypothetical protein